MSCGQRIKKENISFATERLVGVGLQRLSNPEN